jgi:MFS family permease
VANAVFGIVSILVIKDLTQGTGRFNVAAGTLAMMVGIGAAVSTTIGGLLIQHFGYSASFLGLAGIAVLACGLLWLAIPETLGECGRESETSVPGHEARIDRGMNSRFLPQHTAGKLTRSGLK